MEERLGSQTHHGDFGWRLVSKLTCFSGLFGVELVGQREQVGVRELHELRGVLLNASCGVVDELDPTGASLCSDVVLDGASNLALAEEGAVDELVQKGPL